MDWKQLANIWENIRLSFWFVPSVCIAVALLLAYFLPGLDRVVEREAVIQADWIFAGDSSAARDLLAAIAQSLITVISLAFSITIVVLQQASSQYTPHVIGNFIRSVGNQLVLGVYVATFLYALLILGTVRGEDSPEGEFIPALAITFAIVLALVCVGLLVYFIHKTATSIQVSSITQAVHNKVLAAIEPLYPRHIGESTQELDDSLEAFRSRYPMTPSALVTAEASGYVRVVDEEKILNAVDDDALWIIVYPVVGSYVTQGEPIIEVGGTKTLDDGIAKQLRKALILDVERSVEQDPLYGIRQLADIGLKALSTGMNDPTTARYALSQLGDILATIASRPFPSRIRYLTQKNERGDGRLREVVLWANSPRFSDFISVAISPVRRAGRGDVHVTATVLNVLGAVNRCAALQGRSKVVNDEIDQVVRAMDESQFTEEEKASLLRLAERARQAAHSSSPLTQS